jgi:hypothetical protein
MLVLLLVGIHDINAKGDQTLRGSPPSFVFCLTNPRVHMMYCVAVFSGKCCSLIVNNVVISVQLPLTGDMSSQGQRALAAIQLAGIF